MDIVSAFIYIVVVSREKHYENRRGAGIMISLRHKNIVIIYMLYFGDMVSLSPFLEILRREAVGSKITLVIDARFQEPVRLFA